MTAWEQLETELSDLEDLSTAIRLMTWDQAAMMPPKGGPRRARAIATLEAETHRRLTSDKIGDLLGELSDNGAIDQEQAASVRVLRRTYDRFTKVPGELVRAIAEVSGNAYMAWTEARPESDFSKLQPLLTEVVALKKEEADAVGWEGERYDALLDVFEPEMKTSEATAMFDGLMEGLKPMADEIVSASGEVPEFLIADFEVDKQRTFCNWLVEQLGFDTQGGRLDTSPHPFTMAVSAGDVRQTTRFQPNSLLPSVFAAIHETGHALYAQGIPERLIGLPVGQPPSLGLHESQSRLWENQVGRSRAFTAFMLPHLKELFAEQLGMVSPDDFYRAANHAKRSLIRVDADEVTYNLHVFVRFKLELAMFRDELEVADLPGAWNDAYEEFIGLRPESDGDGVLQDMHWPIGLQGYFPTYTLGTLYAAAFFDKANEDLGGLEEDLQSGNSRRLLEWLRENVHSKAYLYPGKELGERVIGGPLTPKPFLDYIKNKYGPLYDISV